MNGFNLIKWQDECAAELMAFVAMGRKRGSIQIRLVKKRMAKELVRHGYTNEVANEATIRDTLQYAELLVECGIPNHGTGWAKRLG